MPQLNSALSLREDHVHPIVAAPGVVGRELRCGAVHINPIEPVDPASQRMQRRIVHAVTREIARVIRKAGSAVECAHIRRVRRNRHRTRKTHLLPARERFRRGIRLRQQCARGSVEHYLVRPEIAPALVETDSRDGAGHIAAELHPERHRRIVMVQVDRYRARRPDRRYRPAGRARHRDRVRCLVVRRTRIAAAGNRHRVVDAGRRVRQHIHRRRNRRVTRPRRQHVAARATRAPAQIRGEYRARPRRIQFRDKPIGKRPSMRVLQRVDSGKVRRIRVASHVRIAPRVHRDRSRRIPLPPAQVRAVNQGRTVRAQLHRKRVLNGEARALRLERASRHRKAVAQGEARHIRAARVVHRDTVRRGLPGRTRHRAIHIRQIDQRVARRIEFGHERDPAVLVLRRIGKRETQRRRRSRHIGAPRTVHRDPIDLHAIAGAPQPRRVNNHRVDHQRLRRIVRAHLEPHLIAAPPRIPALDRPPRLPLSLVQHRLLLPDLPARRYQHQVAVRFEPDLRRPREAHPDLPRIAPRRYRPVILQFPLIPVIHQVDPRIYRPRLHPPVIRHSLPPLRRIPPQQIIRRALLPRFPFEPHTPVCPRETHAHRPLPIHGTVMTRTATQPQGCPARTQRNNVAVPASRKTGSGITFTYAGFETQR